jgi:uncharacterized protein YukE
MRLPSGIYDPEKLACNDGGRVRQGRAVFDRQGGAGGQRPECGGPGGVMAGSFGDAEGVRRLGEALLTAGRGAGSISSELSGHVGSIVPAGWSGDASEAFNADWNRKADRAGQLAAICMHIGQVLIELASELDAAGQGAGAAQQASGGVAAARFGDPVSEQRAQQMLRQATAAADQARAAARSKLAGIRVPEIGPPLTASEVSAWAGGLAPGRVPVFTRLFGTLQGDVKDFARRTGLASAWGEAEKKRAGGLLTIGQEAHFAEGIVDGFTGMVRGLDDLVPGPDGGLGRWLWGDPSASQSLQGLSHLVAPFLGIPEPESPPDLENFGKGLVAWNEWHTDPARAAGNVTFNIASLFAGSKLPSLSSGAATETAEGADAADMADGAEAREEPGRPPGPPPASFGRPTTLKIDGDRPDLPPDKSEQLEYRPLRTPKGQPVPLFDGSPGPEQAMQLKLGDCGLIAALRSIARYRPEAIEAAVAQAADGQTVLRLHEVELQGMDGVPTGRTIEVPMSQEVPTWKISGNIYGARATKTSWAAVTERALAAIDRSWTPERIKFNDDLWRMLARRRGLDNEDDVNALVDVRGYARLNRGFTQPEIAEVLAQLSGERASATLLTSRSVEGTLSRLVRERKPIIVASRTAKERGGPSAYRVAASHAYEVTAVKNGKVILKNPWGRYEPKPVPTEEFLKEFNNLIVTLG